MCSFEYCSVDNTCFIVNWNEKTKIFLTVFLFLNAFNTTVQRFSCVAFVSSSKQKMLLEALTEVNVMKYAGPL